MYGQGARGLVFRPKSGQVAATETRKRLLRRGCRPDRSEKNPFRGGRGGNPHSPLARTGVKNPGETASRPSENGSKYPEQGNNRRFTLLKPVKTGCRPWLWRPGLEGGQLVLHVALTHRQERSAQAHEFRHGHRLDVQESAQGRNQPVASVALLGGIKPTLSNRLADQIQRTTAMLSLPKPIERLPGSMRMATMAAHSKRPSRSLPGGWGVVFPRTRIASRPQPTPRAFLDRIGDSYGSGRVEGSRGLLSRGPARRRPKRLPHTRIDAKSSWSDDGAGPIHTGEGS